jgi:carbonic anhydrase
MKYWPMLIAGSVSLSALLTSPPTHGDDHSAPEAVAASTAPTTNAHETGASVTPLDALKFLQEGNSRFAKGESARPHQSVARREAVAKKQTPFAVIVTCSDSRLTPEFIFDQGIGDLFVVRVAGNTIDKVAMGSIQYAIQHLGSRLIVVMGHERCGAVDAALAGGKLPGDLPSVVAPIKPACDHAHQAGKEGLEFAIRQNVRNMVRKLSHQDPIIKKLVTKEEVQVIGMRYDLESGVASMVIFQ